MKWLLAIVVFVAAFSCLPDSPIVDFVHRHVPISGDGEAAMDDFALKVLAIKAAIAFAFSLAIVQAARRIMRPARGR